MEVAQETSTEQNTSMEELKMDEDDNVKETSMEEDILGAQSLLMSESDDEGNGNTSKNSNKSPLKKISPKRTKRIVDSDDEGEANKEEQYKEQDDKIEIEKEQKEEDDDEEVVNRTTKKKISPLIDSDSDNDDTGNGNETSIKPNKTLKGLIESETENDPASTQTPKNDNSDIENQKKSKKLNKKSKKLKKLSLSDNSDSENSVSRGKSKTLKGLIDSESENDSESTQNPRKDNLDSENQKKSKKLHKKSKTLKKSSLSDNSDSENSDSEKAKKAQKKSKTSKKKDVSNSESSESEDKAPNKKVSSLVDSEDSKSGNDSDMDLDAAARAANFEGNNNDDEAKGKIKKTKVMRASAKKALDEMQAIQSEQQRLHREAHISIPYHKPKKHTLQEFLKRRTIIQPQLSPKSGSPASAAGQMRRIKMTTEEMEEYAKLMEERAKEAKEFFKSESEDEEDKIFKDNPGVLDKQTEQDNVESEEEVFKDNEGVYDKPKEQQSENYESVPQETTDFHKDTEMEDITNTLTTNMTDEVKDQREVVQLTDAELEELLAEEQVEMQEDERPTCSKVLITEVIELPKLDMNTVKISPVKKHTPRTSLNIKQLLDVKNLAGSPSLSGDPNKLIDLETGDLIEKKPTGIENLMQRLMSSVKARKSKTSETCNILSTENGKLEMTTVNVSLTETKDKNKEPKPGAAYFELKKNLKEIMKKKRMEEMHKKQEEELEYSKCLADDDDEEEEEEEEEDEEYEPDANPKNKTIVVDDEENAVEVDEDGEEVNEVDEDDDDDKNLDNENDTENVTDVNNVDDNTEDENDDEEDDEDEDEDSDEEEVEETTDATKRKNRIIKAFDDSDDDDLDFLKTPQLPLQPITFDTQSSEKMSLEDKENELMALCSGTFETQKSVANALMSQIPLTQNTGKLANDEELMELCSGTFETQPSLETQIETQTREHVEHSKHATNKILSSDEEDELENNRGDTTRVKKLTKKLKKKKAKLGFSDDEDEDDDNEDEEENDNIQADDDEEEENEVLESAVEEPETFVDYDSEENEILVQMTKKDKVKQAANFFEKEAELSESEWGSADEDEKHMDKYDIELGDEDEFDREKLQAELGQIHARKMLDDDLREVRKIQDMLFEDEEKDGVGRQRTFKWKNAESGFSLDDGPRDENADQNGDSGDEMNEHQWRKLRYEREQFLKEQGLKPGSQDMSTTLPNTTMSSINNTTNATTTTKKLQIITAKKTSVSTSNSKKSSPFLISKGISTMHKKSVRGSFLIRDKETLNKLAGLTKGQSSVNASDMDNTAGTVSLKSIKAKNFVFATLTEEEHENIKRKADDLLNSSTENGTNFMKKPRIEPRRDKCFIDQLL